MKVLIFVLAITSALSGIQAQDGAVPRAFVLGTYESGYEILTQTYKQTLLEACGNDMQVAFDRWLEMMQQMESYADRISFNIDGVKVFLQVFWDEDGSIAHMGYLLRPNSRNIPSAELTAFFSEFAKQYKFPITSSRKYTHYTKASFPTYHERAER